MTERFDVEERAWPLRPWIMAAIGAVGGLVIHLLTNEHYYDTPFPVWKQAAIVFTAVSVLSFLLTVELRRWLWSVGFAVGWGAVAALVGWFTAQYNRVGTLFEFPFLSGIMAVLLAAPLFQTIRDEGAWRFPYARLHRHAWTDAVIGAASLFFTGITFLLCWLIASLFNVIGIEAVKDLLEEEWFSWMLAGFAFGGALGILRERDALLATLQKLVMIVLAVLAPVLSVALAAFLLSLPFTGLDGLWESDIPATPMLLLSGAGAFVLVNAVIGDGREEKSANAWLRRAALVLALCILPLAILAALSMGERINQYGWTPERMWAVVAVGIAIAYGATAWWAVFKGRQEFDEPLRPLQTKLAIGLCGLALFLALPILDFGAISARSQLARLHSGKVTAEEFDWTAMAFDFGPEGRERLAEISSTGPVSLRKFAKFALTNEDRATVFMKSAGLAQAARLDRYLRVLSPDIQLTDALKSELTGYNGCNDKPCALLRLDKDRLLLISNPYDGPVHSRIINLATLRPDTPDPNKPKARDGIAVLRAEKVDLRRANIEVRTVQRRQLYVDGKPVDDPFE